jgi:GNAT superfamily N-acetyltransferase
MYHSKVPSYLRRAAEVLRSEGVRSLWFRILGETVYRRMILIERPLHQPGTEVQPVIAVSVSLLHPNDLDEYFAHCPHADAAGIRTRLKRGYKCFVARHQQSIASTCWAAIGSARIDYLDCEIQLAPDEAYTYDSYTAPRFRNLNIAAARGNEMVLHFRHLGYSRFIAAVMPENKAAFRPAEKVGYRRFGTAGYVRLGLWRRLFCRVDGSSRPLVFRGGR